MVRGRFIILPSDPIFVLRIMVKTLIWGFASRKPKGRASATRRISRDETERNLDRLEMTF